MTFQVLRLKKIFKLLIIFFRNMNKFSSTVLFALFSFVLFSCGKNETFSPLKDGLISLYEAGEDSKYLKEPVQQWHTENACICVVYGYGYNDQNFVSKMNEQLYSKYGNYEDGGFILSYVYPDDFKRGTKSYITLLDSYINDNNLKGLILLGAPEGTYKSIARMQDSRDGKMGFPVISIFSQDDVVAMEDSADFVLDKSQKSEINGLVAETDQEYDESITEIIDTCAWYCRISESSFEKNAKLYEIVKKIAKNRKVGRYTDTETGLVSINHFVLE